MPAEPEHIDFVEAELKRFSPFMKPFYRDTLLSPEGKACLAGSHILDNGKRFSHWMGQFGGETAGGSLQRESLVYSSVKRIREVWPVRAARSAEADLLDLVRNPVALGDWAYGGRLGNAKGTPGNPHPDGYDFRGGGWLQTTGRANVEHYCARIGIPVRADILDDPLATLRFACAQWVDLGCNELADADNLLGISKAINTGSATSSIDPNGMEHRAVWLAQARAIWWDAVPVEEELPRSSAINAASPPPPKAPGKMATAARSTSVRSLVYAKLVVALGGVMGFFKMLWDWLLLLLDILPSVTADVGGSLDQGEKIAKFLSLTTEQWIILSAVLALPLIAIAIVRHTNDKQALAAQAQSHEATP